MPRKYKRKPNVIPRATWREEDLENAIIMTNKGVMGVNEASRYYNIPSRTLRRRIKSGDAKKRSLGKPPQLGFENEKILVAHIQRLQQAGFAPSGRTIRQLAFEFAVKLGKEKGLLNEKSNENKTSAGPHWLYSFLERNPELSVRQSEGLSLARAKEVDSYFKLLKETLENNNLMYKPSCIWNMAESGLQLNDKPDSKSAEEDENITVIACSNAAGTFLPPVLIMKGICKKPEHLIGLPPGSDVYMNKQSSDINSHLFLRWFQDYFLPKKEDGKALLILDGRTSHCMIEMLEIAHQNDVVVLCLPSRTTQAFQPLDRSFFQPLKDYFKEANKKRNIVGLNVGKLIGEAWERASTVANGVSGFVATGIYPFNPHVIPEHFFQTSRNCSSENIPTLELTTVENNQNQTESASELNSADSFTLKQEPSETGELVVDVEILPPNFFANPENYILCSDPTANLLEITRASNEIQIHGSHSNVVKRNTENQSPIAEINADSCIPQRKFNKRKQSVELLSSENFLKKNQKKDTKNSKQKKNNTEDANPTSTFTKNSEQTTDDDNVECLECLENYLVTKNSADWIKCIDCYGWLHETCTMYGCRCNICGRNEKRKSVKKNNLSDL